MIVPSPFIGGESSAHAFVFETHDVDGWAFAAPKRLLPRRRDKPGHDG
jgi:hypothetical protein